MEENLITKKELLDTTNISYGSLYRWKRKKLIPDDWFIHRATFTGHETFFPKDKVLDRINTILELKETMSLDEIALVFNPPKHDIELTTEDIEKLGIASEQIINLYLSRYPDSDVYDFDSVFPIYAFSQLISLGTLSRSDVFLATDMIIGLDPELSGYKLVLLRKLGICTAIMVPEDSLLFYDSESSLIGEILISNQRQELTQILSVLKTEDSNDTEDSSNNSK